MSVCVCMYVHVVVVVFKGYFKMKRKRERIKEMIHILRFNLPFFSVLFYDTSAFKISWITLSDCVTFRKGKVWVEGMWERRARIRKNHYVIYRGYGGKRFGTLWSWSSWLAVCEVWKEDRFVLFEDCLFKKPLRNGLMIKL